MSSKHALTGSMEGGAKGRSVEGGRGAQLHTAGILSPTFLVILEAWARMGLGAASPVPPPGWTVLSIFRCATGCMAGLGSMKPCCMLPYFVQQ